MGPWDFGVGKNHSLEWFLSIPMHGPATLEEWSSVSRNAIFVPGKLLPKNGWETIPMLLAMYLFNVVSPVGDYPQHSSETACLFSQNWKFILRAHHIMVLNIRDLGYLFLDSSQILVTYVFFTMAGTIEFRVLKPPPQIFGSGFIYSKYSSKNLLLGWEQDSPWSGLPTWFIG